MEDEPLVGTARRRWRGAAWLASAGCCAAAWTAVSRARVSRPPRVNAAASVAALTAPAAAPSETLTSPINIESVECGTELMRLTCGATLSIADALYSEPAEVSICYYLTEIVADDAEGAAATTSEMANQLCLPIFTPSAASETRRLYRLRPAAEYTLVVRANYGPGLRNEALRSHRFTSAATGLDSFDATRLATYTEARACFATPRMPRPRKRARSVLAL